MKPGNNRTATQNAAKPTVEQRNGGETDSTNTFRELNGNAFPPLDPHDLPL